MQETQAAPGGGKESVRFERGRADIESNGLNYKYD